MTKTTKRFRILAATLLLAGAAGACADEPMAVETEAYEVEMTEASTDANCVIIGGQMHCN